jgi:four helix bundle protein
MEKTEATEIKHFTDLRVWQKAHEMFVSIHKATDKLSHDLASTVVVDQLLRSSGSISASIAEGFNSRGKKHYIYYLDIAHCNAAETENWLYKAVDCVLFEKSDVEAWLEASVALQKMLGSMIRKLDKKAEATAQPIVSSPSLPHMPFLNRRLFRD